MVVERMTATGRRVHRAILFWSLMATAPGVVFLIQVVLLMPANLMLGYVVSGLAEGGNDGWVLLLWFLASGLLTALLWWLVAWLLTWLLWLLRSSRLAGVLTAVIVAALFISTHFPIYGGAGHGPMHWATLQELLAETDGWPLAYVVLSLLAAAAHLWSILFQSRINSDT